MTVPYNPLRDGNMFQWILVQAAKKRERMQQFTELRKKSPVERMRKL